MNAQTPKPPQAYGLPTYDALDLVGVQGQVQLILGNQVYLLHITRSGTLALSQ